jgi:hypothetical protein
MVGIYHNHDLSDLARRDLVFEGNLLLYTRRPSTEQFCAYARALAEETFAPHQPERAQEALPVEVFAAKTAALKTRFTNAQRTKELMRALLADFGCDLERTYFDVPRMRVVPSGGYLTAGVSYAYKAHRDTWYSGPLCQINYWMPAFSIVPGRAMSIFPVYWSQPLPNSSASFDYAEWLAVGSPQAVNQIKADNRKHPLPAQPVDVASELRIAGMPGDLIVFSAAHMHATAPNQTGATRFSVDFRTVHLDDVNAGRGAPNIDSQAKGTTLGDYLRADDFVRIDVPSLKRGTISS